MGKYGKNDLKCLFFMKKYYTKNCLVNAYSFFWAISSLLDDKKPLVYSPVKLLPSSIDFLARPPPEGVPPKAKGPPYTSWARTLPRRTCGDPPAASLGDVPEGAGDCRPPGLSTDRLEALMGDPNGNMDDAPNLPDDDPFLEPSIAFNACYVSAKKIR